MKINNNLVGLSTNRQLETGNKEAVKLVEQLSSENKTKTPEADVAAELTISKEAKELAAKSESVRFGDVVSTSSVVGKAGSGISVEAKLAEEKTKLTGITKNTPQIVIGAINGDEDAQELITKALSEGNRADTIVVGGTTIKEKD